MSRKTPERLFTSEPDAVDDLIEKAALAFHALAEHKVKETGTACEVIAFVVRAIPIALVFKKNCSGERFPFRALDLFSTDYDFVGDFSVHLLPCFALSHLGVRVPIQRSNQRPGQQFRRKDGAEQVLRLLWRIFAAPFSVHSFTL
jgi:hypothetical protein